MAWGTVNGGRCRIGEPASCVGGVARARSVWRAGELPLRTEGRVVLSRLGAGSMVPLRWMAAVSVVCIVAHAVICFPFCVSFIVDYYRLCGSHRTFLGIHQVRPRIQFRKACFSRGDFSSAAWFVLDGGIGLWLSLILPASGRISGAVRVGRRAGILEWVEARSLVEGMISGVGHVPEFLRLYHDVVLVRFRLFVGTILVRRGGYRSRS